MLLNAFYKYVPEGGGRYGGKTATSCQFTVDQRLKTYGFLLNRVNCSLSFLLFICASKGKYVDREIYKLERQNKNLKLHLFRMFIHVV